MNKLEALDIATTEFARRLGAVGADQWDQPTPCADWDVTYLVAHVVGGNRFASLILNGETGDRAVATIMTTPQLGEHPTDDFDSSAAEQRTDFSAPGRLDAIVDHHNGPMSADRFLSFRVFDIALHTWDLAIATGTDHTLPTDLVDFALDFIANEGGDIGFGIQPLGTTGPDSTPLELLLDLTGRSLPG